MPSPQDELALARQAMWDAYVILGFDPDGDNEWHCTTEQACATLRSAAREFRADYDEAIRDA